MPDFASSRTTAVERLQAKAGRYRGSGDTITVKGYTKADGTKVPEYERAGGKADEPSKVQKLIASSPEASFNARFRATKDPTTVSGYKKMFDKVPTDLWGGGDVSISHKMPDGRRVWLYGDTLSAKNGFMHSTALVQKDGKLHVSAGGKQVIPNGGKDPADPSREIIYWPPSRSTPRRRWSTVTSPARRATPSRPVSSASSRSAPTASSCWASRSRSTPTTSPTSTSESSCRDGAHPAPSRPRHHHHDHHRHRRGGVSLP